MIAGSRAASFFGRVMPYAQYAIYAAQLGYVGYNLFHMYWQYRAQMQEDYMNGTNRSTEEVIELVVKPRRKRTVLGDETQANLRYHEENQGRHVNNPERCEDTNDADLEPKPSCSWHDDLDRLRNDQDDEVTVVFDSRAQTEISPASKIDQEGENILGDETMSNASTSLESTDSNKGIVHDIYANCFICTLPLNDSVKKIATLPFCQHPFHESCLTGVLKWHHKCPVCDFHIFSPI